MPNQPPAEPEKDPSDAEDSDEPMTASQRDQISALEGEDSSPDRELTRAEAAQLIDQLGHRTEQSGS